MAPDRIARLKAPAGLDLGAITPDEIALSVLSAIVATFAREAKGTVRCLKSDVRSLAR
jgi:xanthine dehydrogenase accessory factor